MILVDQMGKPCRIWKNQSAPAFLDLIQLDLVIGLRGMLTTTDFYVWQSVYLPHRVFELRTGIAGIRIFLKSNIVYVHHDAIDPDQIPWIFPLPVANLNIEERRAIVIAWLTDNVWLNAVYPEGFQTAWYC